ncbi:MAG: hydantoinase B/oxoprolinase family protein [Clostridia bacterium]|nr:hydantoinase B/oxoprolinase family protein [Clostridia bacterium]
MAGPILLEVVNNALRSVAEQMSVTMVRSSYSTIVKEMMDCSSAIFDAEGRMLSEGANVPIHLNCLGPCLNTIITKFFPKDTLHPGDVILTNHPYAGGKSLGSHHTKDFIMAEPVFYKDKELVGFSVTMLHHKDVGAVWTGDSWTVEVWQEGFLMEPVKLYDRGVRNEMLWNVILNNTRTPRDMKGDLMAQISACNTGVKSFCAVVEKYGLETIRDVTEELLAYSERLTRREISEIRDGEYCHEEKILDDGYCGGPYPIKLKVTVKGDEITFDYTGTDKQVRGPVNSPLSATISATYYAMRCITDPNIPSNQGCQRPIKVIAPEGTLVNAKMPVGCFERMVTDHVLVDLIMGAMSEAVPEKVMADSCGCCYDFCNGTNLETHPRGGESTHRQYWGEVVPGGLGARAHKDGLSVMSCHVTNCPIPPAEAQETEAPMMFIERGIMPDSEGAGKYRSGFAQRRKWVILGYDGLFSRVSQKFKIPPQGIFGGLPGQCSKWIINEGKENERVLDAAMGDVIPVEYGDTVTCLTASGGGCGDPFERDPEKVAEDVSLGLVSLKRARDVYGVALDPETFEVDTETTKKIRAKKA